MSLPLAAGYPDLSSSGASQFIPELWASKFLTKLYAKQVLAAISNTDYEGTIKKYGDIVIVRTIPTGTIREYAKGQDLIFENLESPSTNLPIDHGRYFATVIDSVDRYQSDLKLLDAFSQDYTEQMANNIDTHVLASLKGEAHASNINAAAGAISGDINLGAAGAPFQVAKDNVIDFIVDCGVVVGEQNVPKEGCWMVVPEWFGGIISKSDIKDASMTGDGKSVLRNGRIGVIWPFEIFLSNNLPITADGSGVNAWDVPFGNKMGLTFASQFTEMKKFEPERTFGEAIKGLNVFGHKVMIPEAIGCAYVRK